MDEGSNQVPGHMDMDTNDASDYVQQGFNTGGIKEEDGTEVGGPDASERTTAQRNGIPKGIGEDMGADGDVLEAKDMLYAHIPGW